MTCQTAWLYNVFIHAYNLLESHIVSHRKWPGFAFIPTQIATLIELQWYRKLSDN